MIPRAGPSTDIVSVRPLRLLLLRDGIVDAVLGDREVSDLFARRQFTACTKFLPSRALSANEASGRGGLHCPRNQTILSAIQRVTRESSRGSPREVTSSPAVVAAYLGTRAAKAAVGHTPVELMGGPTP